MGAASPSEATHGPSTINGNTAMDFEPELPEMSPFINVVLPRNTEGSDKDKEDILSLIAPSDIASDAESICQKIRMITKTYEQVNKEMDSAVSVVEERMKVLQDAKEEYQQKARQCLHALG
jgi:hypothetical protein